MDLIFCDESLILGLQRMAGAEPNAADGNYWGLYTNDETPDRTTVLADLDVDITNFALVQKDQTDLTTTAISSDTASIQGPVITFTNTGGSPVDVYGYAILDSTQATLVAAARLDVAPTTVAAGGTLQVIPIYLSRSLLP